MWEILEKKDRGGHQLDLPVQNLAIYEELFTIGVELNVIWFDIVQCHGQINVINVDNQDI